jgi:hypothetical protein
MNDFPVALMLVPIVAVAVAVGMFVVRKRAVAGYDREYASYRAAELAARLGLALVEGDPAFNLYITQADADVARGPRDGRPIHISIRMTGARDGIPLELVYFYRVEQETGITEVRWTTFFECRMSAEAKQPFPKFEVVSRNAPLGPIVQRLALPRQLTGDAGLDGTYLVTTVEPGMAQALGATLPAFATFANSGVHLVGDGRTVSFVMQRSKAPLAVNALYYAEAMGENLVRIARSVGG